MGRGKKYAAISEKVDRETNYELHSAISFLKENATANFDETIEFAFRMGVDPSKSDQAIRSTVALPHGTGKDVRVIVDALNGARPASAKGTYIKRCTVSSTMGPGLRVALKEVSA